MLFRCTFFIGFLFFATLLPAQSDFQWLQSLAGHQSPLATLSYNSAGGLLASGDESGQVFLWEGEAFTKATNWQAHEGKVSGIAFSPNGQWLATAGYDGKVRIWALPECRLLKELDNPGIGAYGDWQGNEVTFVLFSPDGQEVFFGGYNAKLLSARWQDGEPQVRYTDTKGGLTCGAWGSNGLLYFAAYNQLYGMDPSTGAIVRQWQDRSPFCEIVTGPEEEIWAWTYKGEVQQWKGGVRQRSLQVTPQEGAAEFAAAPEGQFLLTANRGNDVLLWSLPNLNLQQTLSRHQRPVKTVTISPDGSYLITGDEEGQLYVWKQPAAEAPPEEAPNGQPVAVQETLRVAATTVTIEIWDDRQFDGDTISLSLNGEWITQRTELRKFKRTFRAELRPGTNLLVLTAHNLGHIPPNTAALRVYDGARYQSLQLHADLNTSGGLQLIAPDPRLTTER
jgi:WD40 repeat protein